MKINQCQFHPTSQANISELRSHKSLLFCFILILKISSFRANITINVFTKYYFSDILYFPPLAGSLCHLFQNYETVKGGCIPSKNEFKIHLNAKLRWLIADMISKCYTLGVLSHGIAKRSIETSILLTVLLCKGSYRTVFHWAAT